MIIGAIDVGIINLALVVYDTTYQQFSMYLVDITRKCPPMCPLQFHTKSITDRMHHFLYRYCDIIDTCDTLLIEQQPLCGLQGVEVALCTRWRAKIVMVSPRSMHKHFNIGNLTRLGRKCATTTIAIKELESVGHPNPMGKLVRKHDVADAICMIIFYLSTSFTKTSTYFSI